MKQNSTAAHSNSTPRTDRSPLNIEQLRSALGELYPRILHKTEVGSTNAELLATDESTPCGTLLLSEIQTAGRGRLGRRWEAPEGSQLAFSLLLRLQDLERVGMLPLAAGVAITDAIPGTSLKWPNDVLLQGRKLCGILAEANHLDTTPTVVLGIGINVSLTEEELPVAHAISLRLAGITTPREELAITVLRALHHRITQWQENPEALMADYRQVCRSIGAEVKVSLPRGRELFGTVSGIGDAGHLLVRDHTGQEHSLSAGDVEHLRPADGGNYTSS